MHSPVPQGQLRGLSSQVLLGLCYEIFSAWLVQWQLQLLATRYTDFYPASDLYHRRAPPALLSPVAT